MDFIASIPWWVWFFFILGVYGTVTQLLKAFSGWGRSMKSPHTSSEEPLPSSREFMKALSGMINAPVREGGTASILNNGDEFYPDLFEAVRSARHHVHLMTYIWRPGTLSDRLLDALHQCLERGVEVRIMVDGLGSILGPRKRFKAFREAGGKIAVFVPPKLQELIHFNHRNHRRAFIIDGRIAYTGGITVADQWLGHAQDSDHWRDTMVRGTGPVAHTLQATFVQLWTNVYGEVLAGSDYYAEPSEDALATGIRHIGIAHSPGTEEQPLLHFFWFSLRVARERLYIANSYFAPDEHIRDEIIRNAKEGVDVRLMLPSRHTDNQFVRWAGQHYYESFLKSGVRVYEYQTTMMHAKHMVVDDVWSIIGSANIDYRSIQLNQENAIGIADAGLAQRVRDVFLEDTEHCREFTLEAWARRPWWCHVREHFAMLFLKQF